MSAQSTDNLRNGQGRETGSPASTSTTASSRRRHILGGLTARLLNNGNVVSATVSAFVKATPPGSLRCRRKRLLIYLSVISGVTVKVVQLNLPSC